MEPLLSARGVWFRYRQEWVLKDVSLDLMPGEILGILGPNASGKTTLLGVLQGILRPERGRVLLQGQDIQGMSRRRVAKSLAVVPQEMALVQSFTVMEVALMGRHPHLGMMGFEGVEDRAIAIASLEKTGCAHLAERDINELSGGERQRVLVARALAQQPRVFLLDEPTAYLDLRHQMELVELLRRLHREERLTVVWVSHDLNLASLVCHRLLLLKGGKVQALGSPQEVLTEKTIWEVYGARVIVDMDPLSGAPRITPRLADLGRGKE